MRRILSGAFIALFFVGFALVSGVNTPAVASNVGPMCWAGSCPGMNKPGAVSDASRPSGPYACTASPAYTFYYNARAVTCPADGKLAVTPNSLGAK